MLLSSMLHFTHRKLHLHTDFKRLCTTATRKCVNGVEMSFFIFYHLLLFYSLNIVLVATKKTAQLLFECFPWSCFYKRLHTGTAAVLFYIELGWQVYGNNIFPLQVMKCKPRYNPQKCQIKLGRSIIF